MAGFLSPFLDPNRILLHVRSTRRTAAINEISRQLQDHPDVTNFQGFYGELLARERVDTTCLGNEIALPHARTEHVSGIVMAVGRSASGVLFENGNQTVRLMFVLGTPRSNPANYLKLVSVLCRIFKDSAVRDTLLATDDPAHFVRTLEAAEARLVPGR